MDNLQEIINTLSEDHKREFKTFINRQKHKRGRKDLDLFKVLEVNDELKQVDILPKIYGDTSNTRAYHALRRRLLKHLMDFIVLKRIDNDTTTASSINGMLSLANYLFETKSDRLAWKYLRKAEELAVTNEQYDLLNSVYNLQITHAQSEYAKPLEETMKKRSANKNLVDEDERANIAYSIINHELQSVRIEGKEINIDLVIKKVLKDFDLSEAAIRRPAILYRIMSIVRSSALVRKDFYSFEPLIIEKFHQAEKTGFSRTHHFYKLNMLYMIAHVLYRNKKFEESVRYLAKLYQDMIEHNRSHYQMFYARYVLLLAANYNFMGECDRSVGILENIDEGESLRFSNEERLNIQLNLSVYYFNQNDFQLANRALIAIGHTDNWCEKIMGREWVLKKSLIEVIIQYELGNVDIVQNRIRAIERRFRNFFDHPVYMRAKYFIGLIKELLDKPSGYIGSEQFEQKVRELLVIVPREQEDLQAMGFYSWLKSKMVRKNYYDVLLNVVNKEAD